MEDDLEDERKLAALRAAIKEGEASGYAEPGSFERIRKELGLPSRTHKPVCAARNTAKRKMTNAAPRPPM